MPSDAPAVKRARVEADGAQVVIVGHGVATSAGASPRRSPPRAGLAIIPPYDDPRIVAGQGTVGLEIAEDMPDVAAVLVPIGGGGLAAASRRRSRRSRPNARVIGVEPELAADARDSLAEGHGSSPGRRSSSAGRSRTGRARSRSAR